MDNIQKTIIKLLIISDDYKYIYDTKDLSYSRQNRLTNFYLSVKKELGRENCLLTEEDVGKIWYKIREKFVKINLTKRRGGVVSKQSEQFYKYCIFLEDYITHTSCDVYKTLNKKAIEQKVYDELIGNSNSDDSDATAQLCEDFNIDNFPDVSDIFNTDTCEYNDIEILDGYEETVYNNLKNEKKKNTLQKYNNLKVSVDLTGNEKSNCGIKNCMKNTVETSSNLKKAAHVAPKPCEMKKYLKKPDNKVQSHQLYPVRPTISALDTYNKTEMKVGSCRAKNEQLRNIQKDIVINDIITILTQTVLEENTFKSRSTRLQLILQYVKDFCENSFNYVQ